MKQDQLRAVIASAQAGSADGYDALLEAYGPRLFAYFLRATGKYHDAEDLLGELMVRLVRRLGAYTHDGRFDQWLFRIAANLVRDRIRRLKAAGHAVSLTGRDDTEVRLAERIPARDQAVEGPLEAAEAAERLTVALEMLDDASRQMILLRHFGEMSFKEIAEVFECPLGTALAKVHRGVRALRKLLSDEDESQ